MQLHLVRHGQDEQGYRGGWSERGLSEIGWQQVRQLAEYWQASNFRADTLLGSDLTRARQTGTILAETLKLPLQLRPEWREANNGVLAGLPNAEAEQRYPGIYWAALDFNQPYEGGESPAQFQHRILTAFEQITDEMRRGLIGPTVVIVTHGGPIQVVASHVLSLSWTNKGPQLPTTATGIYSFALTSNDWSVVEQNATPHLLNF